MAGDSRILFLHSIGLMLEVSAVRQISSLSNYIYSHIRELRCIRPYLDSKTASTIAASIVHAKLDYCNSLYLQSS